MANRGYENTPANTGIAPRVLGWIDSRTGIVDISKKVLDEHIPGGARFAYVFGSGLLFIFLLQAVTGVSLALYYTPTAETAHTSVAYITKQVAGGAFLRSLHSYGASAMIIVLVLHFLQTFFYGSFKGRRELLWASGALLSLLVLGMGFTGYLLPWDQKAYFATAVGTNIMGQAPFIGNMLTRVVRGGDTIGTLTLSRFYVAHVFLIPSSIFLFIAAHVLLFRKAGPAGPVNEHPVAPKLPPEHFYPRQVLIDMAFVLVIMAVLSALSFFHPVTLGPIANPADTHFLPRPEWYYLPMFEWLKLWEGPNVVIGVLVIPGLLAMVFFLLPFIDRGLERKPWRRPIPALAVSIVVLGMVYLGVKSRYEDRHDPAIANQLSVQEEQEKTYTATSFEPFIESNDVPGTSTSSESANPQVAVGKGIFITRGCTACHGIGGIGTAAAPSLVSVTHKFSETNLIAMLHNPTPRMRAGRMPSVDAPPNEMSALVAFLGVLGSREANVAPVYVTQPSNALMGRFEKTSFSTDKTQAVEGRGNSALPVSPANSVTAGRQIYQETGCFVCHGQAGAGGRAPALAPLVSKLTDSDLAHLLQQPNARMQAGGMPSVTASPDEISVLITYLRSLPTPQAAQPAHDQTRMVERPQSSPRTADPAPVFVAPLVESHAKVPSDANDAGRALFVSRGCVACHGMDAHGTRIAPSLIGVADRFPNGKLAELLRNPTSKMRSGGMPSVSVSDALLSNLVDYLSSLRPVPANQPVLQTDSNPTRAIQAQATPSVIGVREFATREDTHSISFDPVVTRGKRIFEQHRCESCHGVDGMNGTVAAPGLAGTASLLPESDIEALLRHHSAKMQAGGMPPTNFNAMDMRAIVAYIHSLNLSHEGKNVVAPEFPHKNN